MKKYILMICAAVALVCSCDKYADTISDLESRLDAVDASSATLLTKVQAIQVLAQAKASETTIESVKTDANGITVKFSNGSSYIIKDGQNGANGKDGEEFEVDVTEDENSYTFDFGSGDVISISKAFAIQFEEETIEAPAASVVTIKYSIESAGETTHVFAEGEGCKVLSIDEEACEITARAAGKVGAEVFVKVRAIRNEDSKVSEKFVTIVSGPREPIALDGALSGYYGDSQEPGVDNYFTQFWKGEVDDDNYFVGDAYSIIIDLWTPIDAANIQVPAGTYEPADTYEPFTFTIGVDQTLRENLEEELWLYSLFYGIQTVEELAEYLGYSADELDTASYYAGSELYHQFEDGTYEDYGITGGTVTIELNGTTYNVTMDIEAGGSDWTFTYSGAIEVEDHRPEPWTPDEWDTCEVSRWDDYYSDDTCNWSMSVRKSNSSSNGTIYLELLAPADCDGGIAEGTYTVGDEYAPFTVLAGENYSYWYKSGMVWDEASEGTLTVESLGNKQYHIVGIFKDTYYSEDWGFDFTGEVAGDVTKVKHHAEKPSKISLTTEKKISLSEMRAINARERGQKAEKLPFHLF